MKTYGKDSLNIFVTPKGNYLHIKKHNVVVIYNAKGEILKIGKLAHDRLTVIENLIQKGYKKIR